MADEVMRELFPHAARSASSMPPRSSIRMSALLSADTPPRQMSSITTSTPSHGMTVRATRSSSLLSLTGPTATTPPLNRQLQRHQCLYTSESDSEGSFFKIFNYTPPRPSSPHSMSTPLHTVAFQPTRSTPRLSRLLPAVSTTPPLHRHQQRDQGQMESESNSADSLFDPIDLGTVDLALNGRNYRSDNPVLARDTNYSKWTVRRLRAECSKRDVGVVGTDNKENRIKALELYDQRHGAHLPAGTSNLSAPKRTKHCIYQLTNVLTSNAFSTRLAQSGNTLDGAEVDAGAAQTRLQFWKDVAAAYKHDREEYRSLKHEHHLFSAAKINPGTIREHSAPKLRQLWSELNGKYKAGLINSTKPGHHEPNFENYIAGNDAVLYLWMCFQGKPNLFSFARGGMLEADEYASIRAALHPGRTTTTPAKGKRPATSNNTPRKSPRTRRKQQQESFNDSVEGMLRSVSSFLGQAQAETRSSESGASFDDLDNLRERIIGLQSALETASGEHTWILEDDLEFYMRKRSALRAKLLADDEEI